MCECRLLGASPTLYHEPLHTAAAENANVWNCTPSQSEYKGVTWDAQYMIDHWVGTNSLAVFGITW